MPVTVAMEIDTETSSLSSRWETFGEKSEYLITPGKREVSFRFSDRDAHQDARLSKLLRIVQDKDLEQKALGNISYKDWEFTNAYPVSYQRDTYSYANEIILAYENFKKSGSSAVGSFTWDSIGGGVDHAVKRRLQNNLLIKVRSRHDPLRQDCSPQELQARFLLRDLLTEKDWRGYVTNGFIMVRGGQTHRWYQIFRSQRPVAVYENGKKTHTLCIHTNALCPPTDHIINLKMMLELDEQALWDRANKTDLTRPVLQPNDMSWDSLPQGCLRDMVREWRNQQVPRTA